MLAQRNFHRLASPLAGGVVGRQRASSPGEFAVGPDDDLRSDIPGVEENLVHFARKVGPSPSTAKIGQPRGRSFSPSVRRHRRCTLLPSESVGVSVRLPPVRAARRSAVPGDLQEAGGGGQVLHEGSGGDPVRANGQAGLG